MFHGGCCVVAGVSQSAEGTRSRGAGCCPTSSGDSDSCNARQNGRWQCMSVVERSVHILLCFLSLTSVLLLIMKNLDYFGEKFSSDKIFGLKTIVSLANYVVYYK